jgi:hypothetical protein
LIDVKCRKGLPLRIQDKYKYNNMGCTTAMYLWKSYVILLYEILIYLRNIFRIRITLPICWTTKPFYNFSSKCINKILLFIVISYLQIKEMICLYQVRVITFSQFSGCWLILSVYILMSFDFPFVRLFEYKRKHYTGKVYITISCKQMKCTYLM